MPSRRTPDPFAAQLGARIRRLRKEKQMSLQQLARASGLSRGHLSDIERGKVVMTVGTLGTVAGALEVPAFILCLIPKDEPGVLVMEEVLVMADGDPKKAAKALRRVALEMGPLEETKAVPSDTEQIEPPCNAPAQSPMCAPEIRSDEVTDTPVFQAQSTDDFAGEQMHQPTSGPRT